MNNNKAASYFLLLLLIASLTLVYFIAKPFFGPLILAAVFAFLFQAVYTKLLMKLGNKESLAAFCTTIIALVVVLLPIAILGTQILKESSQLYTALLQEDADIAQVGEDLLNQSRAILPFPAEFTVDFSQYARQGLEILVQNFGTVFSSVAKLLLNAFVFLTAFYFFLKDGPRLKKYLVALSPLEDTDDEFIATRLKVAVSAAVKGNLAIGLVQGVLTGIGFTLFGVPNAALWGGVAVIAAFLPGIGTALVIAPAILYLFLTGNSIGGTGLFVWGITAVGLVDNVLGPRLIGNGMQLHPLAVFIAVLGGLAFFGPLGFLLGPLVMSVCLALIDIQTSLQEKRNKSA